MEADGVRVLFVVVEFAVTVARSVSLETPVRPVDADECVDVGPTDGQGRDLCLALVGP